jgi:hypothetical protein
MTDFLNRSRVRTLWQHRSAVRKFRSAVSLHSHTLYSYEPFAIIPGILRRGLDVSRLWWTPPLSPRQAWRLERDQIEDKLGCQSMVSLTDHDTIVAPLMLRVLDEGRDIPISVEWTVPYQSTFFHLGVHNLEASRARSLMSNMAAYTNCPLPARLGEILSWLNDDPAVLVVVNHPFWDESGIGRPLHRQVVEDLIREHGEHLHALELNGLRSATENERVFELGCSHRLPVVSGGDRHGREPSSGLNLTDAAVFSEFVAQVRRDGRSEVLWMPQQRKAKAARLFGAVCDILRDDPHHGMGWTRWNDRVFYRCDDGSIRPLSAIGDGGAGAIELSRAVESIQLMDRALRNPKFKAVMSWASAEDE